MNALLLGPIIGGLAADKANLWGRADSPGTLHAWLGQQPDLSDAQLAAQSLPLDPNDGYAGVAPLVDLTANTTYHYWLTLDADPPAPGQGPLPEGKYPSFTTFPPDGQPHAFTFALGSCFLPDGEGGGAIFNTLEERRQLDNLRFILMIGDQIYADDYQKNGIGQGACTLDDYRGVYAYNWQRPPLRNLLMNLPAFMTLDDHEVDDDWRWLDQKRRWATIPWWNQIRRWLKGRPPQERHLPRQRVLDALQAFWEHQVMHAPPFHLPFQLNQAGKYDLDAAPYGALAYTFTYGAAAFFVLDTRTYRVKGFDEPTMLGPAQLQALKEWLLDVKDTYPVKFLVTSCAMLFRMFTDIPRDRWVGFPEERDDLLAFLAAQGIEGLYLLTGDLHSGHAVSAELESPQGKPLTLWEFCASPFEQKPNKLSVTYNPFPFGPVKRLKRHFTVIDHNFGVVHVDFPPGEKPHVRFKMYSRKGTVPKEAGD